MIATGDSASTGSDADTSTGLRVRGMTCQGCARHVREALEAVPGVAQASVDLPGEQARVRWAEGAKVDPVAAVQSVVAAGYEAEAIEAGAVEPEARSRFGGWAINLAVGVPVTAFLMAGEWALGLSMTPWFRWVAFGLATVVQVVAGARFYRGAWLQLKARSSNMDTLVALGSTTAWLYSIWALFQGTHVYFMEAAAIITLISAGHWLETRMSERAAGSMKKLLSLAPAQARRRLPSGEEETVSVSSLRQGDVVVLRPGDRVPTDGEVIEGRSSVEESMLTGESMPVEKSPGGVVYGGTINVDSRLEMRVTAVGRATALAQIIAAVERAQNSRASIQRLGDRVSGIFVPIVVGVAIATALWWGLAPDNARAVAGFLSSYLWPLSLPDTAMALAVVHAAAVLIIACPCAMGLATPAAIMAGTNAAAERGILIRDGIALEKAGTITTVVFDKTGTLTHGQPRVTERWARERAGNIDVFALAAEMARHSNHPLSKAISSITSAAVPVSGWRETSGSGSEAMIDGRQVRLGSLQWVLPAGEIPAAVEQWRKGGRTVVAMAISGELAAAFALEDTLKSGVVQVVRDLKKAGLRVCLLTGDNRVTAEAIAAQAGIDLADVAAEVRPEQKAAFVRDLQEKSGQRVAFVGDGINDAPALEQADLGIAVGRASDIARMAADIVLLKSDVQAIPESIGIARSTLRAIRQNLFWAFFYNAAAIPLAALGFLSPVLCALAMGLSDVVVIGNALRLRRWRP